MFKESQYIPILRHKRAELYALRNILESDRKGITPLIEVRPNVMSMKQNGKFQKDEDMFYELMKRTAEAWGNRPYFIDFYLDDHLDEFQTTHHPISLYFDELTNQYLRAIPVIGLERGFGYQEAVKQIVQKHKLDLCIRLVQEDLKKRNLERDIKRLLERSASRVDRTHIVVDLGITNENHFEFSEICSILPYLDDWLTFTIASGAFPKDLTDYPKNSEYLISRDDFEFWQRSVIKGFGRYRLPSYSDFTIQHARYSEPPENSNPSASIRYTHDKDWVLMRGEGLKNPNGRKNEQYWAHARMLIERNEYCGKDFSFGDEYIFEKSKRDQTFGDPETWLRAGINHHITFAARQVSRQFSPSTVAVSVTPPTISPLRRERWNRPQLSLPKFRGQRHLFGVHSQN